MFKYILYELKRSHKIKYKILKETVTVCAKQLKYICIIILKKPIALPIWMCFDFFDDFDNSRIHVVQGFGLFNFFIYFCNTYLVEFNNDG